MPKKHTGLTIEEHKELGNKIKQLKQLRYEIINTVWGAYGKSCRAGIAARSVIKVDTLIRELDNIVCRETTKEEWDQNGYSQIYYG